MIASRTFLALICSVPLTTAQDWSNYGGNAARNGRSAATGPTSAALAWQNGDDFSIIAWHPFTSGQRVFTVREAGFPQAGGPANDAVVAYDVATGNELWRTTLPYAGDPATEWIAWIGAARDGRVFASRSSNQQPQPILALDESDGSILWTSADTTEAWAHDGFVFAPNGDLIVGDFTSVRRIRATDGTTVWTTPRACPVSGNCGVAATATAVFLDEPLANFMNTVTKLDLATGARLYSAAAFSGFTIQNTPFLSPDGGTVYLSRTQNNPTVDFLYAFTDTGTALDLAWQRPVRWTTSHEHAIADDGSIYTFLPTNEFVRLDPTDGSVAATTGPLAPIGSSNLSPKTAIDGNSNVYVSNGWASTPATDGRMWAFSADLATNYFTLTLDRLNAGGPVIAADGTLLVCDRVGVHAYREVDLPTFYCTPKTSSAGCLATLTTSAPTSQPISGANDYSALAENAQGQKNGFFFFGLAGAAALPFSGGTLCMNPPLGRTPIQNSGGSGAVSCDGTYARIVNDGVSLEDPGPGNSTWLQVWQRDPQNGVGTLGTALSDAVELTYL